MRQSSALLKPVALVATILAAASGCDKPGGAAAAAEPPRTALGGASEVAAGGAYTDLSGKPNILYQVFGERDDPRLLPVATLTGGRIDPIVLSADGWRRFDALYHAPGAEYTIYVDGRAAGWARVTRPMWDDAGEPLYALPRCNLLTPLAAAQVTSPPPVRYLVEHIATDAPIAPPDGRRRVRLGSNDGYVTEARGIAGRVVEAIGIDPATLAALDFRTAAVHTGATDGPTLVISFIDPTGGAGADAQPTHVFVLADRADRGYVTTYSRIVRPNSARSDYRRYIDHLDLTGDGVDELILEGWSTGRESYLLILQHRDGRWQETFRGRPSWCLDRATSGD